MHVGAGSSRSAVRVPLHFWRSTFSEQARAAKPGCVFTRATCVTRDYARQCVTRPHDRSPRRITHVGAFSSSASLSRVSLSLTHASQTSDKIHHVRFSFFLHHQGAPCRERQLTDLFAYWIESSVARYPNGLNPHAYTHAKKAQYNII